MRVFAVLVTMQLLMTGIASAGVDASKLQKIKQTPQGLYLTAKSAAAMIKKNYSMILFVDVRSQLELEYRGWTNLIDANIPYMIKQTNKFDNQKKYFQQKVNKNFEQHIKYRLAKKGLTRNDKIIFLCRSGGVSAAAATYLSKMGYYNIYTVVDGFEGDIVKSGKNKGEHSLNGWKNADLSWSYQLEKDKMYFDIR